MKGGKGGQGKKHAAAKTTAKAGAPAPIRGGGSRGSAKRDWGQVFNEHASERAPIVAPLPNAAEVTRAARAKTPTNNAAKKAR